MGGDYERKRQLSFLGHRCFFKSRTFLAEEKGMENRYPASPSPNSSLAPWHRAWQDEEHRFCRPCPFPTFLARLVYPKCLQVPNTRAFVLRVGGVLLCLSQDLGEGQLHVLVHRLQQEVPAPQVKARQKGGCQEEPVTYPLPSVL